MMNKKNKRVCYNCANYFTSYFCGYNECRCKVHGSLDVGQKERHPDTAAETCEQYVPKPITPAERETRRPEVGTCRGCGATIRWIRTTAGKAMPCDRDPVFYKVKIGSSKKVVTPYGDVISCEIVENKKEADGQGYNPHWSTCPNARDFRKKEDKA